MKLLLLLVACAAAAPASDISGIWSGHAPGRNGEEEDITFQFRQDGAQLSGKLYADSGDLPILDGRIEGDQIRFSVVLRLGPNPAKFNYSGAVTGSEIKLKRERDRPGEKQGASQSFTLKRMT